MPIISSYKINTTPEGSDIMIGTDVSNGQTKNFSIAALSITAINLWLSKISWKFIVNNPSPEPVDDGTIFFSTYGGAGTAWSSITSLEINTSMVAASNSLPYLQRLVGRQIIIQDRSDIARYGVYELNSLTQIGSSNVYTMSLTFVEGNGTLTALQYYSIQIDLPGVEGDKNYVHNQAVPSITWNVQHNLNKFPSVVSVNNNNIQMYGEVVYVDKNNLTINFSAGFSGKAYIN